MNDKKLIVTGLVVFLVIVLFPFWYNRGKAVPPPEVKLTEQGQGGQGVRARQGLHESRAHAAARPLARDGGARGRPASTRTRKGKEFDDEPFQHLPGLPLQQGGVLRQVPQLRRGRGPYCWDCHIDNPKEKS